jgi:hypothetical protein
MIEAIFEFGRGGITSKWGKEMYKGDERKKESQGRSEVEECFPSFDMSICPGRYPHNLGT